MELDTLTDLAIMAVSLSIGAAIVVGMLCFIALIVRRTLITFRDME